MTLAAPPDHLVPQAARHTASGLLPSRHRSVFTRQPLAAALAWALSGVSAAVWTPGAQAQTTTATPAAKPVAAQAAQAASASEGDAVLVLGRVTVAGQTGPRPSTRQVLTSVDVLGGDQVAERQFANAWEMVGLLPGIQLTETRMGAESGKATFRAFNGEGYINGIKVLIDGVPSNVNSGNQRFIDMVLPLDVERIEVVRGTNDPRHGLHAIGGSIDLITRQGGRYSEGRATVGSFGTQELQAALGREAGGHSVNVSAGVQRSEGWRDHAASERRSAGGKWFAALPGRSGQVGLVARTSYHEAEEPGYMTASELAANRRQSFAHNGNDRSDREMHQVSAHLDWQPNAQWSLSSKLYANRYKDDRRVTFTGSSASSLNNLPRQRRVWEEDQTGVLTQASWRVSPGFTLDGGVQFEHQRNRYQRYRYAYALPTSFETPTAVSNHDRYAFSNQAVYLQAVLQPSPQWQIVPALRLDRFDGRTRIDTSGVEGTLQDYGTIRQPKISVVWRPATGTSVYANWGRTFQILTGSRAPAYLTSATQARYAPSINTGSEVGVKWALGSAWQLRAALWRQDATDEVANMPSTGTNVGLGRTRREGLDLQATWRVNEQWQLWASHALQSAKVRQAFTTSGVSLAGKEVFSTPRHITTAGATYTPSAAWQFSAQARAQGSYFIDDLNAQGRFGAYALLDLSVRHALTPGLSIDVQVKNATNRQHAYAWYDSFFWPAGSAQPMFSPGAPRAVYLSLNARY